MIYSYKLLFLGSVPQKTFKSLIKGQLLQLSLSSVMDSVPTLWKDTDAYVHFTGQNNITIYFLLGPQGIWNWFFFFILAHQLLQSVPNFVIISLSGSFIY